jgi:HAD superfamily hydrolase (TIGR01459 family)
MFSSASPRLFKGIGDFADAYDYFILDVWGVLYDGRGGYPGVPDVMRFLKDAGKQALILSNSPKRAARLTEKVITAIGITPDTYRAVVTSGEASHHYIDIHHKGARVYTFMPEEENTALEGLDITRVGRIEDADVIYGSLVPINARVNDYAGVLASARARNLTFVCGNPDRVVGHGDDLVLCAGSLAEAYERLGGKVVWIGKPYAPIYEQAWEILGKPNKSKMVAIGDSLVTDIAGAANFGCDVVWNVEGIHWDELTTNGNIDNAKVSLILANQPRPAGLLHGFAI